ncbi:hypothetical protein KDA_43100 [Dictyobacter alpinus]|uniref:Uncharacterized protein n=1 Tax=Dictyobacter alpinus TaxID=2014873 RepID=A0A402BBY2_9CHLR|nr:hypothetical protein [Dictyobacter alpinus]GCE28826.1 hypothetical protein KDA_43100 [Dictyobacter alpinus]
MFRPRNISGGIFLIGLALAIIIGHNLFLPIFFVTLAFTSLFASGELDNPQARFGSLSGFVWLLTLALCFLTGQWALILLGIGATIILRAYQNPINDRMRSWTNNPPPPTYQAPPPTAYYQPPSPQAPERSYNEGYPPAEPVRPAEQPPVASDPYAAEQYDRPQTNYPVQPPPIQQ